MSGAGLSWISLAPSRERRLWLFGASAVSAILALIFGAAALSAPAPARLAAGAVSAVAALAALLAAVREPAAARLSIDADGAIWIRRGTAADEAPAERLLPRLPGDRVVTFAAGKGTVIVWRDSLPADVFRRLSAHARWHVERASRPAPPAP